jgi:hypothetical protein
MNRALVYNSEDLILAVDVGSCGSGRNIPLRPGIFVKETPCFRRINPPSSGTILCVSVILRPRPLDFPDIDTQSRTDSK